MTSCAGTTLSKTHGSSNVNGKKNETFKLIVFIKKLFKYEPDMQRASSHSIAKALFELEGVRSDAHEVNHLFDRYGVFFNPPYWVSLVLSIITSAGLSYYGSTSIFSFCIGLGLLSPFLFIFYSSLIVAQRLFKLDSASLSLNATSLDDDLPGVSVVIASRNEPFSVSKMTFDSALNLEYPEGKKEIIVVDNSDLEHEDYGRWQSYVESFGENGIFQKKGLRVEFIHRNGTAGYKPKNLDIALSKVSLETVLYLDVDSTLTPDSLLKAMPLFQWDSKLAFVQLHSLPSNAKFRSKLSMYHALQNYFLRFGTAYLANTSHALFYGHNAIWQTKVLREIGDSLEYHCGEPVVAEDLSMTLRASFKGYYGTGVWVYSGEWVPESLRESESMWLRWTVGTFQVFARHRREISRLKNTRPLEFSGWLHHCGALVAHGAAPVFAAVGVALNSWMLMFLAALSMVPEMMNAVYGVAKFSFGGMSFVKRIRYCYGGSVILGSFLNWVRMKGLFRYVSGQKQGWVPTGKSSSGQLSWGDVIVERWGFTLYGVWCLLSAIHWILMGPVNTFYVVLLILAALQGAHALLAVFMFGKSTMQDDLERYGGLGDVSEVVGYFE